MNAMQPTALVHEACPRLVGDDESQWHSRGYSFAVEAVNQPASGATSVARSVTPCQQTRSTTRD